MEKRGSSFTVGGVPNGVITLEKVWRTLPKTKNKSTTPHKSDSTTPLLAFGQSTWHPTPQIHAQPGSLLPSSQKLEKRNNLNELINWLIGYQKSSIYTQQNNVLSGDCVSFCCSLENSRRPTACVCGYKRKGNQAPMLCSGHVLGHKCIAGLVIMLTVSPGSV